MRLKKIVSVLAMTTMVMGTVCACGSSDGEKITEDSSITVISREESSGTRSAFVELVGVTDEDGNDITVGTAEINSSTSVVLATVKDNPAAIGYVSLGALNEDVCAVKVDGAEATLENVKSGEYKISRPFNIAYKEDLSDSGKDFIKFILSKEGQSIVEEEGYISVDATESYSGGNAKGTIKIAGSTSVAPVMKVLAEEYEVLNPDVKVEVTEGGSSAGMTSAIEGACDIGMASRAVKDSEKEQGLIDTKIAIDGIAVIVNKDNGFAKELTSEQIRKIYTGEIEKWSLK